MTQTERIVSMLEAAGDRGVTSRDFIEANIFRYGARVKELRDRGFEIACEQVRPRLFNYTLTDVPRGDGDPTPPSHAASEAVASRSAAPTSGRGDFTEGTLDPAGGTLYDLNAGDALFGMSDEEMFGPRPRLMDQDAA